MSYFDLLHSREYFDVFLSHFNSKYGKQTAATPNATIPIPQDINPEEWKKFMEHQTRRAKRSGEEREIHYSNLIKRYYMIGHGTSGSPTITSNHVTALISNRTHINDAYESLRKEFLMGMRGLKLFPFKEFWDSIQVHKQVLMSLTRYKMESIASGAIPQGLLDELKLLFCRLKVVPPKEKPGEGSKEGPKLVAVSKTLHFLLPDLVMPVDRAKVLSFLGKKGDVPSDQEQQFAWFREVFGKYIELTAHLGLTSSNGDGHWWNTSVPKRIDNAIIGFWDVFSNENLERIICGNIGMLLSFLRIT
jgi:hypothetical protein